MWVCCYVRMAVWIREHLGVVPGPRLYPISPRVWIRQCITQRMAIMRGDGRTYAMVLAGDSHTCSDGGNHRGAKYTTWHAFSSS
jgi:hypothetical protein